jgi:hypothetical protein
VKLRILDNSIRLRLGQAEVASLQGQGYVSSTTGFPDAQVLSYTLESSPACVAPTASFANGAIIVRVPESSVRGWATSAQVTIEGEQILDDGDRLLLRVEKDFSCLVPSEGEDDTDAYPHPKAEQDPR